MNFLQVCSTEQVTPSSGQSIAYMLNPRRASIKKNMLLGLCIVGKKQKRMRSAMHLPSDVHICDTDHQNSMTEINSFDIYSRHKQSVYYTL